MKKPKLSLFALLAAGFAVFLLGFTLGRLNQRNTVVVSVPPAMHSPQETVPAVTVPETTEIQFPIDLNTATEEELRALPGIGEVLAQRILTYRQENGPFSAPEELLNVEDIGEKRLEAILDYIIIGG